ncbi:MAG TPA: glycosyltransferase [Verrucomicrobiae bacterium]
MERPLLTFFVVAFNQERFIREAATAALAQTYSPLQVILSDDCSRDRSFEILRDVAQSYHGPHEVVLNRPPQNVGLANHLNRVMELAKGQFIVGSAGDDVSLPERTEVLWRAWEESGRQVCSLSSAMRLIDEEGADYGLYENPPPPFANDLLQMCRRGMPGVGGAAHAWDRRIFDVFGPLRPDVAYEDRALPFRSLLLGRIAYVNQPLVLYRRHREAMTCQTPARWTPAEHRRAEIKRASQMECVFQQWLADLAKAPHAPPQTTQVIEEVRAEMRFYGAMQQEGFTARCRGFLAGLRAGVRWNYLARISLCSFFRPAFYWWLSRKGIHADFWTTTLNQRRERRSAPRGGSGDAP